MFVINHLNRYFMTTPLSIGGTTYSVEIVVKDSQSGSTQAGAAADELINTDGVDVVLVAGTPDTTNPVADRCEANAVPCISTVAPWQQYFFGRNGDPQAPFRWTFHFFWGLDDLESVYLDMWDQVDTNKTVAALWPDDPDGRLLGDPTTGLAPALREHGYAVDDAGYYPVGADDFSEQISAFTTADAEILLGVPSPRDFDTFWMQARQEGFNPKVVTISRAVLFPSSVADLGESVENIGTEVWWSPSHPFSSSLTGQSTAQLADTYTADTDAQWTQPIGFAHALFEVAVAAVSAAGGTEKQAVADALTTLRVDTIVGTLDWTAGPVPNVARTPLVGGQWRAATGGPFSYELVVVSNSLAPQIPTGATMEPIP